MSRFPTLRPALVVLLVALGAPLCAAPSGQATSPAPVVVVDGEHHAERDMTRVGLPRPRRVLPYEQGWMQA